MTQLSNIITKLPALFVVLFGALLMVLWPEAAHAQASGFSCAQVDKSQGILTPIVTCVTVLIDSVSSSYFDQMANILKGAIMAAITLAIALLGARAATGGLDKPLKETSLLIIRIVVISFFVLASGATQYIELLKDASSQLSDIFLEVLLDEQTFTALNGDVHLLEADGSASPQPVPITLTGGNKMWAFADDTLSKVLGLSHLTGFDEKMVGIAIVLVSLISAGPVGAWLITVASTALFFVFSVFALAIFTYMIASIAISIIGAIGPLMIPMILFTQTRSLFDKWLQQLLSYFLQPVVLTAYLIFMLSVMAAASVDFAARYIQVQEGSESGEHVNALTLISMPVIIKDDDKQGIMSRQSFDNTVNIFSAGRFHTETEPTEVQGASDIVEKVPFCGACTAEQVMEMFIDFLVLLFMAMITLSFIQQLPSLITDIIGDKTVPNLADQFGASVQSTVMSASNVITSGFKGLQK